MRNTAQLVGKLAYWHIAVSYTHLDVYKRQGLLSLDMLQPDTIKDTVHAYQMAKRCNVKRVMAEAVKWGERGAGTVSYTHLLYKYSCKFKQFYRHNG